MRVHLVGFVGLLTLVGSIAYGFFAHAGSLDEDAFKKIPIGKATKFSNLTAFDAQAICLLQPYQDRLSSKDAVAVRVNKYLAANNYSSDEGHFAFVLVGKEAIEIASFERSQKLDVLAKHEVSTAVDEMLPNGVVPFDCASGERAVFVRVLLRARTYVLLGELHKALKR